MSENQPAEPNGEKPKKGKGIPTWLLFLATFAAISLLGNVLLGGNTWITAASNFVTSTINQLQPIPEDNSDDPFCLTGKVSEIDRENTLTVVNEADALVQTSTGAIGFAAMTDDPGQLADAINTVRQSGPTYIILGERLLTAVECMDPTYEYLMKDFGDSLVSIGNNFSEWDPQTLSENPLLLITVVPLIEQAANKAQAILVYVENLN